MNELKFKLKAFDFCIAPKRNLNFSCLKTQLY
jgi:hypothetical protein